MTDPHVEILCAHPSLAALWGDLADAVWAQDALDHAVLELCRLRVATLLGAEWAIDHRTPDTGVDEDKAGAVASWPTDERFDDLDRACLEVTELFVIDAHALTDEQMAAVSDRVGAAGLVQLTTGLAVWDGIYRVARTLA